MNASPMPVESVRFVKELYPRLEDAGSDYTFFDHAERILWQVCPDAPMGWSVHRYNLMENRASHTRGGFHPDAVRLTLREWGLPDGARWAVTPSVPKPGEQFSSVYLIGAAAGAGLVKIGRSLGVSTRLAELQRMCPVPLTVLWTTRGDFDLEARLHRAFAHCRKHGEWFDLGDDPVGAVSREVAK